MNLQLSALAIILLFATGAQAQEATTPSSTNTAAEDCSKQVWPNFTPSCLRNSDKATNVRLVSTEPLTREQVASAFACSGPLRTLNICQTAQSHLITVRIEAILSGKPSPAVTPPSASWPEIHRAQ
jgi:hypothetical protein